MMQYEFENLAGYTVSSKDYDEIIEPMYMAVNLSKQDFVKCIDRKRFEYKAEAKPMLKLMAVRDHSGCMKTPNGCYYHVELVRVIDVRIKDGKYVVAPAEDKDYETYHEENYGYFDELCTHYDMDYTDCIDSKTKKPVELHWVFR